MFFVFLNRKANLDKVFFPHFFLDTKQTPKKKKFFFLAFILVHSCYYVHMHKTTGKNFLRKTFDCLIIKNKKKKNLIINVIPFA